jgi:hypothetical protein
MVKRVWIVFWVATLMLAGCGGSSNIFGGSTISAGTGDAQGVYLGTSSNRYAFESIVLPNDKFYGIYGTTSANGPIRRVTDAFPKLLSLA